MQIQVERDADHPSSELGRIDLTAVHARIRDLLHGIATAREEVFAQWGDAYRRTGSAQGFRPLAASSSLVFRPGITLNGAMLLLPLYFQVLRGTTVLRVPQLLVPQGQGILASRILAGFQQAFWWAMACGTAIMPVSVSPPGRLPAGPEEVLKAWPSTAGGAGGVRRL